MKLEAQEGFDVSAAALNAANGEACRSLCMPNANCLVGSPMPVDVASVTQGNKRVFSFMSQAIGLMSELDLGTEHLRFMGDKWVFALLSVIVSLTFLSVVSSTAIFAG